MLKSYPVSDNLREWLRAGLKIENIPDWLMLDGDEVGRQLSYCLTKAHPGYDQATALDWAMFNVYSALIATAKTEQAAPQPAECRWAPPQAADRAGVSWWMVAWRIAILLSVLWIGAQLARAQNGTSQIDVIEIKDDGVSQGSFASPFIVDCTTNVSCTVSNGIVTVTASLAGAGIVSLGGLVVDTQLFAIGTTGTAPNWVSAVATHTLHVPMASTATVTAGLLSKADYDIFNAKQATLSTSAAVANQFVTGFTAPNTFSRAQPSCSNLSDAGTGCTATISNYAPLASPTFTGTVTIPTPFTLGAVSVLPTGTELNFVDGVTSAIQTQLDGKQASLGFTPPPNTLTLTAGSGLGGGGDLSANRTFATASGEADFFASGALTCGAATQGKAQVHTTPLQYCDNAATPTLRYAAYGDSSGTVAVANGGSALTTAPAREIVFLAGACDNATAGTGFDLPTASAATTKCWGTTTTQGTLEFVNGATRGATNHFVLPRGWTGNVDVDLVFFVECAANCGNTIDWSVKIGCVADGVAISAPGAIYNAASTSTVAYTGTTLQRKTRSFTNVATSGTSTCAAQSTAYIMVERIGGSDTMAYPASLLEMVFIIRVTPQA